MACKQNLDLRCVLISDPGTLGAGAKTRLRTPKAVTYHEQPHCCRFMIGHSLGRMESRIKKFTPHYICRYKRLPVDQEHRLSSMERQWLVDRLPAPRSRSDIAAVLGTLSILRPSTIATLLLDDTGRQVNGWPQCLKSGPLQLSCPFVKIAPNIVV